MGASIEPYPIGLPRILNPRFLSLACVAIVGWFLFAVLDPELAAGQQLPNWPPLAIDVFPDHNEFVAGKRPVQELVDIGRKLFRTTFSILDGRPDSTGDSKPTIRVTGDLPSSGSMHLNGSFRVELLLVASRRYPQPGQGHPHVRRRASRRRACVGGLIISNRGRAEESLRPTIERLPEVIEGAAYC
jgi:hypothetical protein